MRSEDQGGAGARRAVTKPAQLQRLVQLPRRQPADPGSRMVAQLLQGGDYRAFTRIERARHFRAGDPGRATLS